MNTSKQRRDGEGKKRCQEVGGGRGEEPRVGGAGGGESFNQSEEVSPTRCRVAPAQASPLAGEWSPPPRELLH